MSASTARQPTISLEFGGSGLAGARHIRDERERRQRTRRTRNPLSVEGTEGLRNEAIGFQMKPRPPRASPRQRRRIEDAHAYLCAKVDPIMGSLIFHLISMRPADIRRAALDYLLSRVDGKVTVEQNISKTTLDNDGVQGCTRPDTATPSVRRQGQQREHANGTGQGSGASGSVDGDICSMRLEKRLVQRADRLFMAREIGPLITELINRTLRCMPAEVEGFLIEQLRSNGQHKDDRTQQIVPSLYEPGRPSSKGERDTYRPRTSDGFNESKVSGKDHAEIRHPPTRRPSTARSRLQEAQTLDLCVQKTSAPSVSGGEVLQSFNGSALCSNSARQQREAPTRSGTLTDRHGNAVLNGVKESRNMPWDCEVSSKTILPPTDALAVSPSCEQARKAPQVAVVLLLGLDGAGKTTLLGTLQGDLNPRVRPSVGFKPVTMMLSDLLKVNFYDLGGGEKIRSIWDKYYHDVHALIYVIDGTDRARWKESKDLFLAAADHKYLQGKPVAVVLNKEDAGMKLTPGGVADELHLSTRHDAKVYSCSASAAKAKGGIPDERLEEAVEWLLENVKERFSELNERVQRDLRDMDREFQAEKERKQLGVMRGLLRKAFPPKGSKTEDCFDKTAGLEFLSSELGLEDGALPYEGIEIAALVGYQKLALQMVGNLKSPISRKNRARSWQEIRDLVTKLRREVGIDVACE